MIQPGIWKPDGTIAELQAGKFSTSTVVNILGRAFQSEKQSFTLVDGTKALLVTLSSDEHTQLSDGTWVGVAGRWNYMYNHLCDAQIFFLRAPLIDAEQAQSRELPEALFLADPLRLHQVRQRAALLKWLRTFLETRGFLEVQTPILHAAAESVYVLQNTTQSVNGRTLYLRTDPEEYLKRYLTIGFDAVYEISTNVRPDWPDALRLQEFTSLELYHRFWTLQDVISICTELITGTFNALRGSTRTCILGQEVDLTPPFACFTFEEIVQAHTTIDIKLFPTAASLSSVIRQQYGWQGTGGPRDVYRRTWLEWLLDTQVLPALQRPTLIIKFPTDIGLSAITVEDQPECCWRGEFYLPGGLELINFYVNLTETHALRRRYEERLEHRIATGLPSVPLDEGLFGSTELGMPPMAGAAIGIDRLLLLLVGHGSVGDGLLFPYEGFSRAEIQREE